MANITQLKNDSNQVFYPQTHEKAVIDSNGVNLQTKLASITTPTYVTAWDGASTPVVANIPAGVTVTYNTTSYTGTLAASASTANKTYLVSTGTTDNYNRYVTQLNGSTYSWQNLGSTEIGLSDYAKINDITCRIGDDLWMITKYSGYRQSDGTNKSDSNFNSCLLELTNGKTYIITPQVVDGSGNYTRLYTVSGSTYAQATFWRTNDPFTYTCPSTGTYELQVVIDKRVTSNTPSIYILGYPNTSCVELYDRSDSLTTVDVSFVEHSVTTGIITPSGSNTTSSNWNKYIIPNNGYKGVKFHGYTSSSYMAIAFYNSESWGTSTFMSSYSVVGKDYTSNYNVQVPNGCKLIIICNNTSHLDPPTITLCIGTLANTFKNIANIQSMIDAEDSLDTMYSGERIILDGPRYLKSTLGTASSFGTPTMRINRQGGTVWNTTLIQGSGADSSHDSGLYFADLSTKTKLGEVIISNSEENAHFNCVNVGAFYDTNDILPMIFASESRGGMSCWVLRFSSSYNTYTLLNSIVFQPNTTYANISGLDWMVDNDGGYLWAMPRLSTSDDVHFLKFSLPTITGDGSTITLSESDILDSFTFTINPRQGGFIHNGRMYLCLGYGQSTNPGYLWVIDLTTHQIVSRVPLSGGEPEFVALYDGGIIEGTPSNYFKLVF